MYVGLTQHLPFPLIHTDIAMRDAVAHKNEIRFMEQSNGTTVCSYVVSAPGTFDCSFSREARGIVFDSKGKVVARPLHKFFNVNEKPETLADKINWNDVMRVMDKRDGSMIHTVKIIDGITKFHDDANFTLKSKKSYESDVAVAARKWIANNVVWKRESFIGLCNYCTKNDLTAIFEWTAPTARIVVYYADAGLQLLHIRNNITGEYFNPRDLKMLAERFNVPVVEDYTATSITELLVTAETVEGIEGWVVQFSNGDMVKLKTKWYMERHKAMTFLRERDIAAMVLNESLDDLKALLVGEGADITEIEQIEAKVVKMIEEIIHEVSTTYAEIKDLERKQVALELSAKGTRPNKYFSLIMQKFSGKEPDYNAYFERNLLSEVFTLRQLNLGQTSVAEVE